MQQLEKPLKLSKILARAMPVVAIRRISTSKSILLSTVFAFIICYAYPFYNASCTRTEKTHLVVGISLGCVLLQEFQVFLGSTGNTLILGGGNGSRGGGSAGRQDGFGRVELGKLGGQVGRQGRCLGSSGGSVRLDAGQVSVGGL